jgi:hypothetical protein
MVIIPIVKPLNMIKFFRRIRQQLLTENRFSKPASPVGRYLLYAIGEIVLVVLGILIALSVNNWNQENKDRRSGEDYLFRIHRDLVQDTINFRNIIHNNNLLREDIKQLLVTLYDGVESIEEVQYMGAIYDKALDQVFSPNDNTYKGMISSGTLGLIKNPELKEEIVELYSEYDQKRALLSAIGAWMINIATTETNETDFIKFNNGVIDIFTTQEMLNENDFSFLNDKEDRRFKVFVKAISATAFNQTASNAYYLELINRCNDVLQHIDEELK